MFFPCIFIGIASALNEAADTHAVSAPHTDKSPHADPVAHGVSPTNADAATEKANTDATPDSGPIQEPSPEYSANDDPSPPSTDTTSGPLPKYSAKNDGPTLPAYSTAPSHPDTIEKVHGYMSNREYEKLTGYITLDLTKKDGSGEIMESEKSFTLTGETHCYKVYLNVLEDEKRTSKYLAITFEDTRYENNVSYHSNFQSIRLSLVDSQNIQKCLRSKTHSKRKLGKDWMIRKTITDLDELRKYYKKSNIVTVRYIVKYIPHTNAN